MIDALVVVVLVATGALAVFGLGSARSRTGRRGARCGSRVGAVVALLAVQAVIAAVRVFAGVPLPETSTFLIYLVVSVCVLPIADAVRHRRADAAGAARWSRSAAIGTAVAVLRLQGLWEAGGV